MRKGKIGRSYCVNLPSREWLSVLKASILKFCFFFLFSWARTPTPGKINATVSAVRVGSNSEWLSCIQRGYIRTIAVRHLSKWMWWVISTSDDPINTCTGWTIEWLLRLILCTRCNQRVCSITTGLALCILA